MLISLLLSAAVMAAPRTADDLGLAEVTVDATWQVCTTSAAASLGDMLVTETLVFGADDQFPDLPLHTSPQACEPERMSIRLLTWADAGVMAGALAAYHLDDVASAWGATLGSKPGYVISYSENDGIAIIGRTATAAQHGLVDLLADMSRTPTTAVWTPKRVLNYPETQRNLYLYALNFRAVNISTVPCTDLTETSDHCDVVRSPLHPGRQAKPMRGSGVS